MSGEKERHIKNPDEERLKGKRPLGDWNKPPWELCNALGIDPFSSPRISESRPKVLEGTKQRARADHLQIVQNEQLVKVKMLQTQSGSPDGMQIKEYKAGETYDIPSSLAAVTSAANL